MALWRFLQEKKTAVFARNIIYMHSITATLPLVTPYVALGLQGGKDTLMLSMKSPTLEGTLLRSIPTWKSPAVTWILFSLTCLHPAKIGSM